MLILFAGHNNYTKNRETKYLIRLYEHYMFFIDLFDIRKSIKSLFD